jgi:serine/threonine protein kinase
LRIQRGDARVRHDRELDSERNAVEVLGIHRPQPRLHQRAVEHDALTVKILDLGLVKLRTAEPGTSGTLTQEGIVIGTPDYMSPEQLLGRDVDPRADLFAVGVMLLETLTGRKTLRDENGAYPTVLADARPSGARSAALDDLLRRCLAADPRDRAASASASALRDQLIPLLRREGAA